MTNHTTNKVPGYTAVAIEGPASALQEAQASLRIAGLQIEAISSNSIVLRDVRESELSNIEVIAASYGMKVTSLVGPCQFIERVVKETRKAFKLAVEPDRWYVAENLEETFPFVLVRDVRIEKTGDNGDADQLIDVEFYGPNHALPVKQTVSSREAASYGLRPALDEDFEQADMIVPVSELSRTRTPYEKGGHGIPKDTPPVDERPNPSSTSTQFGEHFLGQ
jgi:hypothetical protein